MKDELLQIIGPPFQRKECRGVDIQNCFSIATEITSIIASKALDGIEGGETDVKNMTDQLTPQFSFKLKDQSDS